MAPELLSKKLRLSSADIHSLKSADIWSLLMTLHVAINPDRDTPYNLGSEKEIIAAMDSNVLPSPSIEYAYVTSIQYQFLRELLRRNIKINPNDRNSAITLHKEISSHLKEKIEFTHLDVSQSSAIEEADHLIARQLQLESNLMEPPITNDGTNACTFLALRIIGYRQKNHRRNYC